MLVFEYISDILFKFINLACEINFKEYYYLISSRAYSLC